MEIRAVVQLDRDWDSGIIKWRLGQWYNYIEIGQMVLLNGD